MASSSRKSEKDFSKILSKTLSIGIPSEEKDSVIVEFSKSFTKSPGLVVSPILKTNSNSYLSGVSKEGFTIKFSSKVSGESQLKYRASGRVKKDEEIEETIEETRSVEFGTSTVSFYRDDNTFDPIPTVVGYKYNYGRGQNHKWEIVSAPEGATTSFSDVSVLSPTFSTDSIGTHTLKLTVSGDGYTRSDTTTFTVVNRAPTVDLGADVTYPSAKLGDVVLINAATADPDGDSLTSSAVIKSKPSTSTTTLVSAFGGLEITPDVLGTYTIRGTVDDGMGESNSVAVVSVNIVINTPPIAILSSEVSTIAYDGTREIILDGSASSSPVENTLSYSWAQHSKPKSADNCTLKNYYSSKKQKIIAPQTSGQYEIKLTVDDSIESTSTVLAFNVNYPPTSSISGDAKIYTGVSNSYNGSTSATNDSGQSLSYIWDVVDQSDLSKTQLGTLDYADLMLTNKGSYDVNLTVNDGYDNSLETMAVTAYDVPTIGSTVAERTRDSMTTTNFSSVGKILDRLTMTASIDSEGIIDSAEILSYLWSLQRYNSVDSAIGWATFDTGVNTTYNYIFNDYEDPKVWTKYRIKLLITDSNDTTDETISNEWIYNDFPISNIVGNDDIYTNLNYIFDGSGSTAVETNQTLAYSWVVERFGITWSNISTGFTGASTDTLIINTPATGTFRAILTVDDGYDTNSSIHLFNSFKPPEIDSFTEAPGPGSLSKGDRIIITPTILSDGIIADTEALEYFWQLEAYTTKWEAFNDTSDPGLNTNSTGTGGSYMYEILAPPYVYNSYCSKLRVKLTITDSNGTTDEYYSTEWNI